MKVELDIQDFDEKINEKIKESIINPIVNNIENWVINHRVIERHINECFSESVKNQFSSAIFNSLDNGGLNKCLRTISVDVNEIVEKNIESIMSNRLSILDDRINELAKKTKKLDVRFQEFYSKLHSIGNVTFGFINVLDENYPTDVESYVIDTLKRNNPHLIVKKFNKMWHRGMRGDEYRGYEASYRVLDYLTYDLETKGAPDLIVIDDRLIYFVEVKSVNDSIRLNQILWAKNNPDFLVKFLFVNKVSADTWENNGEDDVALEMYKEEARKKLGVEDHVALEMYKAEKCVIKKGKKDR